ncbi:MAG: hypothetical protein QOH32_368 [Bradyrhizobium sp.]|nr:hypothetical protein [Bradyrhizobium sp.]
MPIARYFMFVGCTLAALLFIAGWCLPTPPAMFSGQSVAMDRAVIRIKSAQKWPEKVVLDTSQPAVKAPVVLNPRVARSSLPLWSDKAPDQSNLEAMALLKPDTHPPALNHPLRIKRGAARTARSKAVARGPVTRRLARTKADEGCCQFGWIDNGQTSSNAMSRRHAASSWPVSWPGGIER